MSAVAVTPATNGKVSEADVRAGAQNLLGDYMKIKPGTELLIVNEPSVERHTVEVIEQEARSLGARVLVMWCDRIPGPEALPGSLVKAFEAAETTLFNHHVGVMLRLLPIGGTGLKCFSFANSNAILGSSFCRIPYAISAEILRVVQQRLNSARKWKITCPAGTELEGEVTPEELAPSREGYGGFTLLTFPLGIHKPFSAFEASGRLAIRWLTPAGVHDFDPPGIRLDSAVMVDLDRGKIADFSGEKGQISRLKNYLETIARKVDKDPYIINSWHTGINPRAFAPCRDVDSLERWMFLAHSNPRIVHFHVVGKSQPGEMSAPVLDPTISMDGEVIWDRGRLVFLEREDIKAALSGLPSAREALTQDFNVGV